MSKTFVVSSYTFLPDIGGVATNKYTLCDALVKAGYKVVVVTNTPGPELKLGYEVIRKPSALKLLQLYRTADVVYLANPSLKLGWPAVVLRRTFGLCHHSASAFVPMAKRLKNLPKRIVARAVIRKSVHFPNSRFTMEQGREVLRGLPCAVAYPIALKTKVELTTLKDYKARKDVFFAGRLVEEKGVGFLIDNWPEIKKTLGVERMLIAGDGPMRQELEQKVAQLEGIVMLGRQPLEKVVQGMKEAAHVMIPSIWEEPFGNVGVEGVASGAVVISSNRGGLPEAVGEPGVLFGFESPALFSKALNDAVALRKKIMSSEAEFEAYKALADRHLGQFSAETIVDIIRKHLG